MNKKILLSIIILVVLLIGIGALVFSTKNVGNYNSHEKTMVIRESILDRKVLAEITLDSPQINYVIRGKDRLVAEFTINNIEKNHKNSFNDMEFYDKNKKMKEFDKEFTYKYKEYYDVNVVDYEKVCEDVWNEVNKTIDKGASCYDNPIGIHKEKKFNWVVLNDKLELPQGELTIGIFTDVEAGESVEWIPTLFDVRIDEWAVWTEALNTDLWAYYTFNATVGTDVIEATGNISRNGTVTNSAGDWRPGIIGNALYLDGTDDLVNFTHADMLQGYGGDFSIVWWENRSAVIDSESPFGYRLAAVVQPLQGYTQTGQLCVMGSTDGAGWDILGAAIFCAGNVVANTTWQQWGIVREGTNWSIYQNGSIMKSTTTDGAGAIWNAGWKFVWGATQLARLGGEFDELGMWNRTLTGAEINQLYNNKLGITWETFGSSSGLDISLNSPENDTYTSEDTISFNASYSYVDLNMTNATFYVYESGAIFNKTNVAVTAAANSSVLNITGFTTGNYEWNVYGCGINATDTVCSWAPGNYTFDWRPFEIVTQTYNGEVYETSRQKFELNITTIPSILSVSSKLIYNGTSYSATTSCLAGACNIIKNIDIPLTTDGRYSQNKSFYFNLTFYDGTSSYNFDTISSSGSQNVSRINLESCNATYTTEALNFTAYDEINLTEVRDFEFGATFDFWLGQGMVKRNNSFDLSPINETTLCIFPNKTYYTDAKIEYDTYKVNSTTYVKRNYYFQNKSMNNVTEKIFLYLLEAEQSTSFIQVVQDQKLSSVIGALILTQRYYPSDGKYRTVQISKTDDNGESIGFYQAEIVDYKHIIKLRGITLLETAAQKVVGKDVPYTLTFTVGDSLTIPWEPWEDNPNILTSLTYNATSKLVTFSYVDSTEETLSGNLLVTQEYSNNNTISTICNTTLVMPSATLTCNMTSYEGTFIARGSIGTTNELVELLKFAISTARDALGNAGLFIGFFIILVAGMAFMWNPVVGIIGINAALWFVSIIGFITLPPIFLFGILGVSIIAIILLKT